MSDLRKTIQSGFRWLVNWYKTTTHFALKAFGILVTTLLLVMFVTGNLRAARQFGRPTPEDSVEPPSTVAGQATASIAETVPPSTTAAVTTSSFAPLSVTPNCSGLACQMSRNSGLFNIPLPEDAAGSSSPLSVSVVSDLSSIESQAKFYAAWLVANGWTLLRQKSVLDPKRAEAKGFGHVAVLSFCTWAKPPRTLSVRIGYRDPSAKTGTRIELEVVLKGVTCRSD